MTTVVKSKPQSSPLPTAEDALAVFRKRGGRITSSRRLLLQTLFNNPRERTAEELAEEIHRIAPDVNLSTIYRNLDDLEQLGVVVHAHLGHGPAVFSLAELAHGHLVCETCETVIELPPELFDDLAGAAHSRYGFDIHPHHFAILGRCQNCQALDQDSQTGRNTRDPTPRTTPVRAPRGETSTPPRRRR